MAEVMALFGEWRITLSAVERQLSGGAADQAGDHAQEGGFSGAIAPGNDHGLAARYRKAQAAKYLAPATVAGQFLGVESHHGCRGPFGGGDRTAPGLENPDISSIFGEVPRSI